MIFLIQLILKALISKFGEEGSNYTYIYMYIILIGLLS